MLLLAAAPGVASADLTHARDRFLHGDYDGARSELKAITGRDADEAKLTLIDLAVRTGDYEEALDLARQLSHSPARAIATAARVRVAVVYRKTGRYTEAATELSPLVKAHGKNLRARYLLARTELDLGQKKRANALLESFISDWNRGHIQQDNAENLLYVALAARFLAAFQDANDSFRDAVSLDPKLLRANLEWGYLFLDKYSAGYAEQSFDEVLKVDPHYPDAHAGMARVKLDQSYDVAAARKHIDDALAVNPKHVPSLLIRAGLEIDQNRWDAAKKTLAEALAVNPNASEAQALLATVYWLRDNTAEYTALEHKILASHPGYAPLYHIIARSAVREHRYSEAISLEKQAVKLDPDYYEAMAAVGTGYLRLGDEKNGLSWLKKAWKGDPYNVRTYNTLELFEKTIPEHYSFTQTEHFKIRYHNDEKAILRRYVEPLLERAYGQLVARYGFTPKQPIVVELFQNPDHYSVRTIGLPNLGALGVCFGRVITAMSPSRGHINWAMVLWHELSHVFAIQLSNSRVPRWYTEGLSEYETTLARPEWRRENDADLYAALVENRLPSVTDLNHGFTNPDTRDVVVAYYLSSVVIEYLARTYGFDRIVYGLKLYGQGLETPQVLEKITGKTIPEINADLRAYLERRLAPYKGSFVVPTTGYDDTTKLAIAADAAPDDAGARAALALGYFFEGDARRSFAAAERALSLDPKNKIALYITAELAVHDRDFPEAKRRYKKLIAAGGDSFDVRGRLGWIAAQAGDVDEAERQLCIAKRLDPERSYPYKVLAKLYEKVGRKADALDELAHFVMLEQMEDGPARQLALAYAASKSWTKARAYGELALHIRPNDPELLIALGNAYLHTRTAKRALFTFESALVATPEMKRPALAHIGRAKALIALGRKREAHAAIDAALAIEPRNAEALAVEAKLKP